MTFYVGQKVVCIDDQGFSQAQVLLAQLPVRGMIYRVRSFTPRGAVRFDELNNARFTNPLDGYGIEPGFDQRRFRPLTDISIFTEILDRVNGNKPRVRGEV